MTIHYGTINILKSTKSKRKVRMTFAEKVEERKRLNKLAAKKR